MVFVGLVGHWEAFEFVRVGEVVVEQDRQSNLVFETKLVVTCPTQIVVRRALRHSVLVDLGPVHGHSLCNA